VNLAVGLHEPDSATVVDADAGEALVDTRARERRRNDVRKRGHAGVWPFAGHLLCHRFIKDREQKGNVLGNGSDHQRHPEHDCVRPCDDGD